MGIEVRHDNGMPTILAAIQLALAQKQQQDQQAAQQDQQGGTQNIFSQLGPILAAHQAAQQPQQPASYASPGDIPAPQPSPDQPRYIRPSVSQPVDHSSSVLRGLLNGQQADERLQNQDALAQFRAQQSDQRLGERNQQQTDLEQLRDADTLAREQQHDLPRWVVEGVQSGHYQYTPAQQKELQDRQTALSSIDSDPRFSTTERAQFKAQQLAEIRRINMSPQPVPPDKWPVTPQQQLAQQTVMKPVQLDENATLNLPMVPYQRDGATQWKLTPDGEVTKEIALQKIKHQQAIDAQNLKHQQALELERIKAGNKPNRDEAQHSAYVKQNRDLALQAIGKEPKATDSEFKDNSVEGVDKAAFKTTHDDWLAKRNAILRQFPVDDQFAPYIARQTQQFENNIGATMGALSMLPMPGGPQTQSVTYSDGSQPDQSPGGADAGEQQLPPPAPTLSNHPEDGQSQWDATPAGAVVTLPDGRTVRKTGDTSFEPVQ